MNNKKGAVLRLLGGIFLVASIAVGAGMLALPIATACAGFWPAVIALLLSFGFMTYCLFLVLEINLVSPKGSHLIGMIRRTLGPGWRWLAWFAYLMLLYAAVAAYITASGGLFAQLINQVGYPWHLPGLSQPLSGGQGLILNVLLALLVVGLGTRVVDYANRFLTLALLVAFALLLWLVMPHAQVAGLLRFEPVHVLPALPLIFLSFTSHLMVPSLCVYFDQNWRSLRWVLLLGSLIPLLMYLVWEYTVLGILPYGGAHGLKQVMASDHQVATMVRFFGHYLHQGVLLRVVECFSLFALSTSLIAASLSLWHFLEDGMMLARYRCGSWVGLVLTFAPPLCFAWYAPQGFTVALGYAGVFVAILFCWLPALMVWKSRYVLCESRPFRCPGGRVALVLVMVVAVVVMFLQVLSTMHVLPDWS